MRLIKVFACVLVAAFIAMPALAMECANSGVAPSTAPDDTGDADAIACGSEAVAGGGQSTALGWASNSGGGASTAVGFATTSTGDGSIALGYNATSTGNYSNALGSYAAATGHNGSALGNSTTAAGEASTAVGYLAASAGNWSTAVGANAYSDQVNTVILGSVVGVNGALTYANVGMGTTNPVEAVDVERSAFAARFQLTSFTDTAGQAPQYIQRRARGTNTSPTAVQNGDNLGLFSFRGHNGTAMGGSRASITAQAAGNFTSVSTPTRLIFATTPVGQTTPQQVLVITPDGKVQVNGQNLTVPDYVFEDDYQLMPLDELKSFIAENGHLPGIPSANEVNSGGHDLAGSDMAHLRKIEELTLYTLQQQERIDRLEKQLASVLAALD